MPRNKYREDEMDFSGHPGVDPFGGGYDFQGMEGMNPMEIDDGSMDFGGHPGVDPFSGGYDFQGMDPMGGFDANEGVDFGGYGGPTPSMDMGYGDPQMGYDFGGGDGYSPMEIDTRQSVSNPIFGGPRGSAIGEAVEAPADMFDSGRDRLADYLLRMSQAQPESPQLPSMEEVDARFRRGR
jgi:hypothetical protein